MVWYSFFLTDQDFQGCSGSDRCQEIRRAAQLVLEQPTDDLVRPRRTWGNEFTRPKFEEEREQTRVIIDNETADHATIIDVFAYDQPGLLYTIAKKLYQLELDIRFAKIGSHVDQIVDVFYVTSSEGIKISDPAKLEFVKNTLLEAVAELGQP